MTTADQERLIASLKALSDGENLESVVAIEDVIRYFVVHNYVVNADSYTGSMIHNYYLYEEDGQLSMIPWDYNLAFGTFQGGDASSMVSDDIDSPLSVTGTDRPMIDWIFDSEEYTQLYHSYFQEFLDTVDVTSIITQAEALIAPYVEKDPTKFCTYEEFEKGVETLITFCDLRTQSITAQLAGEDGTVDASAITLSDMGTMNNEMGGGGEQMPEMGGDRTEATGGTVPDNTASGDMQMPQMSGQNDSQQMPGQSDTVNNPSSTDEATDGNQQFPAFSGQESMESPECMELPEGIEMPDGTDSMFPGQNSDNQSSFPDGGQSDSGTQWVLLGITALILLAGLVFTIKFKR